MKRNKELFWKKKEAKEGQGGTWEGHTEGRYHQSDVWLKKCHSKTHYFIQSVYSSKFKQLTPKNVFANEISIY